MLQRREVTFVVHTVFNQIRRLTEAHMNMAEAERITPMQGRVIRHIKRHAEQEVYQRDLEREFCIRRSTASAILQTMERSGLLLRKPVAHDARLKALVLTPKAEAHDDLFRSALDRVEAIISQGISTEEMDAFFAVMNKFKENLQKNAAVTGKTAHCERLGEEKE